MRVIVTVSKASVPAGSATETESEPSFPPLTYAPPLPPPFASATEVGLPGEIGRWCVLLGAGR